MVVPTDKSCKFAVMSRRAYLDAGMAHVRGDIEVGWPELKEAQSQLNGHVAMMAKIFKMGKNWEHQDRVRETMIGDSMSVCPVSLLFKDHKEWSNKSGKVPPTRHVAGGHVGMNLHLSEIISDIMEPIVETLEGGEEVISSEDLQANLEGLNKDNKEWHSRTWWGTIWDDDVEACIECESDEGYEYDINNPDLCRCSNSKASSNLVEQSAGRMEMEQGYMQLSSNMGDWKLMKSSVPKGWNIIPRSLPAGWKGGTVTVARTTLWWMKVVGSC